MEKFITVIGCSDKFLAGSINSEVAMIANVTGVVIRQDYAVFSMDRIESVYSKLKPQRVFIYRDSKKDKYGDDIVMDLCELKDLIQRYNGVVISPRSGCCIDRYTVKCILGRDENEKRVSPEPVDTSKEELAYKSTVSAMNGCKEAQDITTEIIMHAVWWSDMNKWYKLSPRIYGTQEYGIQYEIAQYKSGEIEEPVYDYWRPYKFKIVGTKLEGIGFKVEYIRRLIKMLESNGIGLGKIGNNSITILTPVRYALGGGQEVHSKWMVQNREKEKAELIRILNRFMKEDL